MTEIKPSGRGEWLAITCVTGAAVFELTIRERFHRLGGEIATLILISVWWVLLLGSTAAVAAIHRLRHQAADVGRLAFLLATAVSLYFIIPAQIAVLGRSLRFAGKLAICGALLLLFWLLAVHLSSPIWRRVRWAASVGCLSFVTSQPFIAAVHAPSVSWPSWPKPTLAGHGATPKSAQIFLLLDELNFSASGPIVDVLKRNGIDVQTKALQSTGDGTAKVVPAMFSGGNFENSKPCGTVIFCGSLDALDFSKVFASRADIDVVGFAMPYCAINGLRFCERLPFKLRFSDWKLWACSAMRRLGGRPLPMQSICANMHRDAWEALSNEIEAAIWRAPIWKEGGFMYAHIPLPHPPGNGPAMSLKTDYAASVARAARLVERIALRAKSEDIKSLTLVIFSDHPLRPWLWCEDAIYEDFPCTINDRLTDSRVPLIVAGNVRPSTDMIYSNRDVFRLTPERFDLPK